MAVKCLDGAHRARDVMLVESMAQLGWLDDAQVGRLEKYHKPLIKNHLDKVVGRLEHNFRLDIH